MIINNSFRLTSSFNRKYSARIYQEMMRNLTRMRNVRLWREERNEGIGQLKRCP